MRFCGFMSIMLRGRICAGEGSVEMADARVAELVDATDSKSVGRQGCVGSSPTPGTSQHCNEFAPVGALSG